jgi:hypothetical protein
VTRRPASQQSKPCSITSSASSAKRRAAGSAIQLDPHVVEEHLEAALRLAQGAAHRAMAEQRAAQQREAADLHAAGVETEELVVEFPRDRQPQAAEGFGIDTGAGRQRQRRQAARGEHLGAGSRRQAHHRAGHESARHRVRGGAAGLGHGPGLSANALMRASESDIARRRRRL